MYRDALTDTLLNGIFMLVSYKAFENSSLKDSSASESRNLRLQVHTRSAAFAIHITDNCLYWWQIRVYNLQVCGGGGEVSYRIKMHVHVIIDLLRDEYFVSFCYIKLIYLISLTVGFLGQ